MTAAYHYVARASPRKDYSHMTSASSLAGRTIIFWGKMAAKVQKLIHNFIHLFTYLLWNNS